MSHPGAPAVPSDPPRGSPPRASVSSPPPSPRCGVWSLPTATRSSARGPRRCPRCATAHARGRSRRVRLGGSGAGGGDRRDAAASAPRHRRRRHLGGGLRGAYGKAWRRGARAAGSRSAHCGGAEQGSRAGSEDDAESSARGARARGPGWGHAAARAQGFFGGGIPWPCIDRSGKPPRVGDRGTGAWLWWPAPLREGKGLQPRGTALLRCWDSSLGVVVDADEEPNTMLFEPAVGCRG